MKSPLFHMQFLLRTFALVFPVWLAGCSSAPAIGFLGTLSGPGSELGTSGRDGVQLATESAGVRMVACDDRADEESAAACIARFDSLGIRVVVGPMTSNVALRVAEEATGRSIHVVSPTVSAQALSGKDDCFARLLPTNEQDAQLLAGYLAAHRHRSVSILYSEANLAYAEPLAGRLGRILSDSGVPVRLQHSFAPGQNLRFDPWIARMEDSSAVVVVGSSMDLGVFLRDRERVGKYLHVLTTHWGIGQDLLRVGGAVAEGVVFTAMPELLGNGHEMEELRTRYRERFARPPSHGAIFAWEAAQIALRIASAPGSPEAFREVLRDTAFAPLGWPLGLDSLGDTRRRSMLCRVHRGRYEALP